MKECNTCHVEKEFKAFTKERKNKGGYMHTCKECRNAAVREKWKDPEYRAISNERRKRWHDKYYRLNKYGITNEQYAFLVTHQNGLCGLCKEKRIGTNGKWCIDHCHDGGHVRGILCNACNSSLGHYQKLLKQVGRDAIENYLTTQLLE